MSSTPSPRVTLVPRLIVADAATSHGLDLNSTSHPLVTRGSALAAGSRAAALGARRARPPSASPGSSAHAEGTLERPCTTALRRSPHDRGRVARAPGERRRRRGERALARLASSRNTAASRATSRDTHERSVLQARVAAPDLRAAGQLRRAEGQVGLRRVQVARAAPALARGARAVSSAGTPSSRYASTSAAAQMPVARAHAPRQRRRASPATIEYVSSSSCSTPRPPVGRRHDVDAAALRTRPGRHRSSVWKRPSDDRRARPAVEPQRRRRVPGRARSEHRPVDGHVPARRRPAPSTMSRHARTRHAPSAPSGGLQREVGLLDRRAPRRAGAPASCTARRAAGPGRSRPPRRWRASRRRSGRASRGSRSRSARS